LLTPLDVAQFAVFVLIAYWLRVARSIGLLGALFAIPPGSTPRSAARRLSG